MTVFSTIDTFHTDTEPENWKDLVHNRPKLSIEENFELAK